MSIGLFDSGLGGLSVAREIRRIDPTVDIHYLADRSRAPYGPRPLHEVRSFAQEITGHLLASGADMIVIACNAASTAALHDLRSTYPDVPFVGMEPAIKPAALHTSTGTVGVLTTAATFQGELFASVVSRFASGVKVETAICEGWVELVEAGEIDGPRAEEIVARHVLPLTEGGADTLVLGCTHYPFLAPLIRAVAGSEVSIVDPGPAVARQAIRIAAGLGLSPGLGSTRFEVTGSPTGVEALAKRLAGFDARPEALTLGSG